MAKRRVLYVLHNHPAVHPGGAEAYAVELYEYMRGSADWEPLILARIGPNVAVTRSSRPGTPLSMVNGDANQYFLFTETAHFDFFRMTYRDKELYVKHLSDFLLTVQPDVVHFQHTLFIGVDLISLVRQLLPDAAIVYTLHEFLPICHRDGQLVRTRHEERCLLESPRRCNECFPTIAPQEFFLRKRFMQSHFSAVDRFLAPSHFLLDRYLDWGIPPEKIAFEDYGRIPVEPLEPVGPPPPRRVRLGFFGQLNYFKGFLVLLRAMKLVAAKDPDVHLWIHGANLELQEEQFQSEARALLEETDDNVTLSGAYSHDELPRLMRDIDWVVVPSIWWENSPLVIQEAFSHRRPVIASDIGGMAEKVHDGVDGLHFRAGDVFSLAETILRATASPDLWEALRNGIQPIFSMQQHVENLSELYDGLCASRRREVAA